MSDREVSSDGRPADELTVIREQTAETLALLRQLIEMLLPKGDPNAPKLEDLLSALFAQQRETLHWVKQIATDQTVLLDRLMGDGPTLANGSSGGSGAARA